MSHEERPNVIRSLLILVYHARGLFLNALLTNRDRMVIENKWSRVKIKSKLTNCKIKSRIEGYNGK